MSSNPLNMTPIDWFNFYGSFASIFSGIRSHNMITDDEVALLDPSAPTANDLNHTTFKHNASVIHTLRVNAYNFPIDSTISKFMLLCAVRFKFDVGATTSYIQYELIGIEIPYIRVGTDYFKVIKKQDRYGGTQVQLKSWKKDEIKQDHSKTLLTSIPKYDDFIIEPNNKKYNPVIKNCYNLYSKFPHTQHQSPTLPEQFPVTWNFIHHIFGSQIEAGLIYLKVLYEHPKQILPVLTLVSKERNTGKTTFINWFQMMFGNNYVSISSDALSKNFNSNYATKNIITFEETFIERQYAIEKLKHLSTSKSIDVSQKFVSEYTIPFYGKFILCTNKVFDFMRIDDEEIRFWIRPIPPIQGKRNTKIEQQLFEEIPFFLSYISNLPAIDFDNGSRMVLTEDQIRNESLQAVKAESKSWLFKELDILISDLFDQNPTLQSFHATSKDIKDEWFKGNNQVSAAYIRKVLKDEAGLQPKYSETNNSIKYYRFGRDNYDPLMANQDYRTGNPFEFIRKN